mmetsp:Transcript_57622/g.137011  ORF Transcript_57622/g.137011 Transcript_57622/m.137011 type:complete len:457 (-) Transcript_57622:83-1453(-)
MAVWESALTFAEGALLDGKFFDGVQYINSCMEAFSKSIGVEDDTIIKDPEKFLAENDAAISGELRNKLRQMYEVRGDIIMGLGANKRAALDYDCADKLVPGNEGVKAKKARATAAATSASKAASDKIPVTVLTGFLGSGKTTLLNRILKEKHGKRIAVIENEFGEVGIDDSLIDFGSMTTEENLVEMNNGCICCTVRGDLIAGLKKLVKNSQVENRPLDGVIIETTGLADPAPVAQTFFADQFVQQKLQLDGILTLVDAKHIIQHLDEEKPEGVENEAVEQVAFADRIILNKCDLVEELYLSEVEARLRAINEAVPIKRATNSSVEMDYILGIKAFSLDRILESDDAFLDNEQEHQHDERVSSVGIHLPGEVDQAKLNEWLGWFLRERGLDVFRTKGVLAVKDMPQKFVFQAVHMAFSGAPQKPWAEGEERICKLTFIGRNLNREELTEGFKKCLA